MENNDEIKNQKNYEQDCDASAIVFRIALRAAEILIKNGAEMSRAEETILRICSSRGFNSIAVLVSPTVVLIGDDTRDGATYIRNIKVRTNNINKVALVNDFSRKFVQGEIDIDSAFDSLTEIENSKNYPYWFILITAGIGCALFSLLLGGDIRAFIVTFLASIVAVYTNDKIGALTKTVFLGNFVAGLFVGFVALLFYHVGFVKELDMIIVAVVLSLVPGVAFTSGIRDFILGDLVSGIARTAEAVLVAVAIAFGIASVLFSYSLFWNIASLF